MNVEDTVTGIQHIGIPTEDMDATVRFYESLWFRIAWRTAKEERNQVAFLCLKNLTVETYEVRGASGKPGAVNHIALDVSDIEAAARFAVQKGYALIEKEIRFLPFWERGVKFFTIAGPNNEWIEFCQKL